jgi:hypothetical protein
MPAAGSGERVKRVLAAVVLTLFGLTACSGSGSTSTLPTLQKSGGPAKPSGGSVASTTASTTTDTPSTDGGNGGNGGGGSSNGPTPVHVPGYEYVDAPTEVVSQMEGVAAAQQGVFTGTAVRTVKQDGTEVGALVILQIADKFVGNKVFEDAVLQGMISGMAGKGAKTTRETYGDQQVGIGEAAGGGSAITWYRDGKIVIFIGGTDTAAAKAFAKAYIAAA